MASVIITFKLMPESPDVDLSKMQQEAEAAVDKILGSDVEKKAEVEPIAFGLKALKLTFVMDEEKGSTEPFETALAAIEGVQSAEVVDVRRAVG